jgi:predicted 2-oxoglutarate/Fe(II)-dependent dioxygenase YbiX
MGQTVLVPGYGRPYVDGDRLDHGGPLVFTIDGVLSRDECAQLIARIDALGPTVAPITTAAGPVMRTDVRNNTRVMFDDPAFAQLLFERVAPHVPARLCGMRPVGANERFRCYRYENEQRFAPHYDGAFVRDEREESLLTFMVYLNEGFAGGDTRFYDYDVSVTPRAGMALLVQHFTLHEGGSVTAGVKYALRTDVMYRR